MKDLLLKDLDQELEEEQEDKVILEVQDSFYL